MRLIYRCSRGAIERTQFEYAGTAGGGSGVAIRDLQCPKSPPRVDGPRIDNQYLLQQLLSADPALGRCINVREQPVGDRIVYPSVMWVGFISESQQMVGLEIGAAQTRELAAHAQFGADVGASEIFLLRC